MQNVNTSTNKDDFIKLVNAGYTSFMDVERKKYFILVGKPYSDNDVMAVQTSGGNFVTISNTIHSIHRFFLAWQLGELL
jgi:hypothetical protein